MRAAPAGPLASASPEYFAETTILTMAASSALAERRSLYPGLYETEEDLRKALLDYAVEIPSETQSQSNTSMKTSMMVTTTPSTAPSPVEADKDDDEYPPTDVMSSADVVPKHQASTDIWGRHPLKEPREWTECPVCKRSVNTLRFAPHLDKCMGIGTMARASTTRKHG